jgi:dihydroflavonol-4-reductase
VDSAKAKRELDYVEIPLDALLADTLVGMKQEGLIAADSGLSVCGT